MRGDKEAPTLTSCTGRQLPRVKRELLDSLPVLDAVQVRRQQMPYGQAIVLELLEQRAYDVAEFLTLMLNRDIELRNAEPQLREWTEPCLIVNKELIDRLRLAVLAFFSDFDSVKTTTMPLIALARAIEEDMSDQYWWIADVLYQCALSAALGQHDLEPDDEFVARLRYTYARFLHYKLKNPRAALEHARIAKMDSCNKSWTLYGADSDFERDSLFKESALLLHHVLLEVADQECDPDYAVKSCEAAIKNAHNVCNEFLESEAHYHLARKQLAAGRLDDAVKNFNVTLDILDQAKSSLNVCKFLCNVHENLAHIYKMKKDTKSFWRHLQELKNYATVFQQQHHLARAHLLAGEYYLTQDDAKEAIVYLEYAVGLFKRLNDKSETSRAEYFVSIAKSRMMLQAYLALIASSGEGNSDAMLKLSHWRDRGEPFDSDITIDQEFDQLQTGEEETWEDERVASTASGLDKADLGAN
ncbi:hypothetical protein TKK_0004366 [Trichogramma kaykai]